VEADSVRGVNRPTWRSRAPRAEVEALDEAVAAVRSANEAEERAQAALKRAWDIGVPPDVLERETRRPKRTMYRRWGPPKAAESGE
jgi:hypothetical protein